MQAQTNVPLTVHRVQSSNATELFTRYKYNKDQLVRHTTVIVSMHSSLWNNVLAEQEFAHTEASLESLEESQINQDAIKKKQKEKTNQSLCSKVNQVWVNRIRWDNVVFSHVANKGEPYLNKQKICNWSLVRMPSCAPGYPLQNAPKPPLLAFKSGDIWGFPVSSCCDPNQYLCGLS